MPGLTLERALQTYRDLVYRTADEMEVLCATMNGETTTTQQDVDFLILAGRAAALRDLGQALGVVGRSDLDTPRG